MASARRILDALKRESVTDAIGVPDNSSAALYTLLESDPDVRPRVVTREGEAFALACGLWMGGRHPVLLIQNTGLIESGDALRGTAMKMRIPLVCLVTYRGHAKMVKGLGRAPDVLDAALLSRSELDSVGLVTEPTLRAWGLAYDFLNTDEDLPKIPATFTLAREREAPIALLITGDTT
jgi:sulfopyruvate decarboxylase subunit alpha